MSMWVHVAAIVRVDGLLKKDFKEIFGKECLWESPEEVWDDAKKNPEKYLPMGSEGSLQMSVWTNPDDCSMAHSTVSIFGDLRDRTNGNEIIEWFKEKCKDLFIRQACITVKDYFSGITTWTYEKE